MTDSKIKKIQGDIQEVKDVMTQNIEKVLESEEKLEGLREKTADLNLQSDEFRKQSRRMRWEMLWERRKLEFGLIGAAVVTVGSVVAVLVAVL